MDTNLLEAYKSASDLAKQLITLSTGILTLSITFTKDIVKGLPPKSAGLLKFSWIMHLLSICCGIWSLMALTGMIFKVSQQGAESVQADPYGSGTLPSILQTTLFILGTALIIGYGLISFRTLPPALPTETASSSQPEINQSN